MTTIPSIKYNGNRLFIFKSAYISNSNLALMAVRDNGNLFGTITINLCDLPKNQAYLDTSNMPKIDEALVKSGICEKMATTKPHSRPVFMFKTDNIPDYSKYITKRHVKVNMQTIRNLRDTIDGELNRIAVTDSPDEIQAMLAYLKSNIEKYAQLNTQKLSERVANHD